MAWVHDENLSEYPNACSIEDGSDELSFFQILGPNGTALDDPRVSACVFNCSFEFSPNEFKDSQFWFLDLVPGSEYGYVGSKKYFPGLRPKQNNKILTLSK